MKFRSVIRPVLPILLVIIPTAEVFAQREDQKAGPKAVRSISAYVHMLSPLIYMSSIRRQSRCDILWI